MRRRDRVAFAGLCLVSGSVWLLPSFSPTVALRSTAIAHSVLALSPMPWILNRRSPAAGALTLRTSFRIAGAAAGAIGGPLLLLRVGASGSAGALAIAALCTAPLWAALAVAVLRGEALQRHLLPAVVALAGALLLLPIVEPASSRAAGSALLCLAAAAVLGVSAVICSKSMREVRAATAFAIGAGANALVLWIAVLWSSGSARWTDLTQSSALLQTSLDLLTAALMLGLLRAIPPLPLMTRFLWTPLIFAAEGTIMFRARLTARMVLGAALIAWGAAVLLRERSSLPDEVPSLR